MMDIGEKIRATRKALGITQQELAGEKFTKGYISQLENGTVKPSMNVLNLIAEKLNKPISFFLDNDNYYKEVENKYIAALNQYNMKNYLEASYEYKELTEETEDLGGVIHTNSLLNLGKCYFYLNDYKQCIKTLKSVIDHLEELGFYESTVEAYLYLGRSYFELNEFLLAIDFFKEGVQWANKTPYTADNYKAKCLLNIATSYMRLGRLQNALGAFEKAALFSKEQLNIDVLLDCHVRIAHINCLLNKTVLAKEHILKANLINRIIESDMVWVEIYNILGMIVYKEGNTPGAIKLLERSMNIAKKNNYHWGYCVNIVDLLRILITQGNIGKAEEVISENRVKIKRLKDQRISALLSFQEAKLHYLKKEVDKSVEMYKSAIDLAIVLNMKWETYYYSQELAEILIEQNPSESKKYYNMSLEYLAELSS